MNSKPFFKMLRSNSGFSLTEVMIGGGILAGVALASAQLFKDQKTSQKKIENDQKLIMFHQNLSKQMNLAENCNTTMKQFVTAGNSIPSQTIPALYRCTANCKDTNSTANRSFDAFTAGAYTGVPMLTTGDYIDGTETWKVAKIAVVGRSTTGNITLKLDYQTNPKVTTAKTVTKDITINTRFNGGQFKECVNSQESSVNNLQNDLCKALNLSEGIASSDGRMARWDEPTQTCIVDGAKDCSTIPGMQIDGISTDGTVHCQPITNNTDAQAIENTASQTCNPPMKPQAYYDTAAKKMSIRCVP